MLINIMKPDFICENECGTLAQLVHGGWKQINVIFSKRGSVRGGHYHKHNTEAFYVVKGKFKLKIKADRESAEHEFTTGDMFSIMPCVSHTFIYYEDTHLVAMYDKGIERDNGEKDIWQDLDERI